MTDEELLGVLDDWAAAAAESMAAATQGASLCSISRSGQQVPGVKYPEGRWAALRELSRALRGSTVDVGVVLAHLRQSWAKDLTRSQVVRQENWIHYRLGGVDALEEVAELLSDPK